MLIRNGASIDADAHVLECEETWEFLEPAERKFRPSLVRDTGRAGGDELWFIDGRTFGSRAHQSREGKLTRAYRTLEAEKLPRLDLCTLNDVPGRLAHMDELNVDVQVLFASLLLHRVTDRVEVEVALVHSYNRWIASRCAESRGRLQWVMELPWISVADSLDEIAECIRLGACGIHARGLEVGRLISDPYFYPIFDKAEELGLPICIHAGEGEWKSNMPILATPEPAFMLSKLPGIMAFHALGCGSVYEEFPRLRFGFVELSASWIPYLAHDMRPRIERKLRSQAPEHLFDDWNVFVACENTDDLDQILRHMDVSHIVLGTDYGHTDTSADLEAHSRFRSAFKPEIAAQVLEDNPRRLYGEPG